MALRITTAASPPQHNLAVVSFWHPVDPGKVEAGIKLKLNLAKALKAVKTWPGNTHTILVTNLHIPDIEADEQVIKPKPMCSKDFQHDFCMPWEAIRVLVNRGQSRTYDTYAYMEGDIQIPVETFNFWRERVVSLHRKGYVLLTHRLHDTKTGSVLTDCFAPGSCGSAIRVRDESHSDKICRNTASEVYIRSRNPYTACFLLNQEQFAEYANGGQSDFTTARDLHPNSIKQNDHSYFAAERLQKPAFLDEQIERNASYHRYCEQRFAFEHQKEDICKNKAMWHWGMREMAASGLTWDYRYGSNNVLTHVNLSVVHLAGTPSGMKPNVFHTNGEFMNLTTDCLDCSCPSAA